MLTSMQIQFQKYVGKELCIFDLQESYRNFSFKSYFLFTIYYTQLSEVVWQSVYIAA
jgi:hypothetical protein